MTDCLPCVTDNRTIPTVRQTLAKVAAHAREISEQSIEDADRLAEEGLRIVAPHYARRLQLERALHASSIQLERARMRELCEARRAARRLADVSRRSCVRRPSQRSARPIAVRCRSAASKPTALGDPDPEPDGGEPPRQRRISREVAS